MSALMEMFTATPQIGKIEVARHYIELHRAQRDKSEVNSRARNIEQIKLDWWVKELLHAIGEMA